MTTEFDYNFQLDNNDEAMDAYLAGAFEDLMETIENLCGFVSKDARQKIWTYVNEQETSAHEFLEFIEDDVPCIMLDMDKIEQVADAYIELYSVVMEFA